MDDILDFFARTMELTAGTFGVDLHDALANDEHTVAMYVARGEREGRILEDMSVLVSHVRNGKLTETWQYSEDQYAVDEFLAESLDLAVHRLRGTAWDAVPANP